MQARDEKVEERMQAVHFYRSAVAEMAPSSKHSTRWKLRSWNPIHTKILVLVQKGMTVQQIAAEAEVGFSIKQLNLIVKDPLFRYKLTQYNKKMDAAIIDRATEEFSRLPEVELAKNKMAESAEKAADTMIKLLNPYSSLSKKMSIHEKRLLVSIAQDILDRAGLKNTTASEDKENKREYSPDEIRSALDNAKELEAISQRLDERGSSYVLTGAQRSAVEESVEEADTVEGEREGTPIETNVSSDVTEESVALEQPPSGF